MPAAARKLSTNRPAERLPSPRQQHVTANLSLIARTWRTLTDSQRQGFTDFSRVWSPNGKAHQNGKTIFQSLNGVRLHTGQTTLLLNAPQQPDFIPKLPRFTLNAALSNTKNASAFTLQISTTPFPHPVQILATRPFSPGVTNAPQRAFIQIAVLDSLTAITDITRAYLDAFRAPAPGLKIAIQIVPFTQNGFRGDPQTQNMTVGAAP